MPPLTFFLFQISTKFIEKVTEVVAVSQLDCVGSRNKLGKQKGPWSLGEVTAAQERQGVLPARGAPTHQFLKIEVCQPRKGKDKRFILHLEPCFLGETAPCHVGCQGI